MQTTTNRDRPRVLLAEDAETARLLTSRLLERMGCDVDAVEHGEQALEMARTADYDVILLDLDMPLMDGAQSAAAIRSLPEHAATPIIAVSAFLQAGGQSSDMWRVFDGEITKPISLDKLREVIRKSWPMRSGELGPAARARRTAFYSPSSSSSSESSSFSSESSSPRAAASGLRQPVSQTS